MKNRLKITYRRRLEACLLATLVLCHLLFIGFRSLEVSAHERSVEVKKPVFDVVPQTNQREKPPSRPPLPALPVPVDDPEIPPNETIGEVRFITDLTPPPQMPDADIIVDFFAVQEKPKLIGKINLAYPQLARKMGREGMTVVKMIIGRDGVPRNLEVLKSSGSAILDEAAMAAVRNTRWIPAMQRDQRVSVAMTMPLRFQLR